VEAATTPLQLYGFSAKGPPASRTWEPDEANERSHKCGQPQHDHAQYDQ